MRFDVKFQDVRVLEYVFAPWAAHLYIVMNPHVDVKQIRVLELLVARAALEHVARGILVLFDFMDLERTRGGEALATVRAHPHSEERKLLLVYGNKNVRSLTFHAVFCFFQ